MSTDKMIETFLYLTQVKPQKFQVSYLEKRGGSTSHPLTISDDTPKVLTYLIQGSAEYHKMEPATSGTVDFILGESTRHTLSFGIGSKDDGHQTILSYLPYDMQGTYIIGSNQEGRLGRRRDNDYYRFEMSVELCIMCKELDVFKRLVDAGHVVYPFKVLHPEMYPTADTSDSGPSSESEQEDNSRVETNSRSNNGAPTSKLRMINKKKMKVHRKPGTRIGTLVEMIRTGNVYPSKDKTIHNQAGGPPKQPEEQQDGGTQRPQGGPEGRTE